MDLKTGATVSSVQLRRLQEALAEQPTLRRQVREIESQLVNLLFKG